MLKRWTWLVIVLAALLALWGCSDDDPMDVSTESSFDVMAEAGLDYLNDSADCPGVISATTLHDNLDSYTVIDIRGSADYAAGHIPGAYNTTLTALLGDLADGSIPAGMPYVLVCYSGQTAGHAKIAMELMGYEDVKTLSFGMASWNEDLAATWTSNVGNNLSNPETAGHNGELTAGGLPVLDEDKDTVVADRVNLMLQEGFKGKAYSEIRDNLDAYFVVNYFGSADYNGTGTAGVPGHIPGAFQFTPYASLGTDQLLNTLPTDKPIIVYCWTGQHSSQVTAFLNMLGYEAYSLKFGSNNLFHDQLTSSKWDPATSTHTYELELGYAASEEFGAIAAEAAEYLNDSTDCPGVISAQALYDNLSLYTVIDIRSAADFTTLGHIAGAYNTTLADVVEAVQDGTIPNDKPLVVACYTGQSAGHAKIALELMGYEDVKTLGFGMASWNSTLAGAWDAACANNLGSPETAGNNDELTVHAYPALAGATLTVRVQAMLDGGFKGKNYTDIQDYLDNYFVMNYFGEADYSGTGTAGVPGHIPGAYQYTPYASLGLGGMLADLPTDKPIVVYCWTGQHSSQVTAYLNILGYEAYSLKFGANSLFHDSLTSSKWTASSTHDFPLVFD